ncbi:MinD superfamily P-loop ATPase, contains an inserted ferredoxin domain [Syntrophus gentianae]|uniref:MinD superfamily P-loop ATPase, contains an inserted ferredoxin domain n=1 Tax=Syntrophus gentianae TaxID=43775 RepID=A0A1H7V5K9_9BACT|nr:P-loop NTPase [Syntrophus gentianae]SEM04374.1 MinD superfamily P-loop ATPase, contains an inserted ferredoxin domain [Syntrophus gentianae]
MKIAVAGGRGGTGKTTLAINFAQALAKGGHEVTLLDCDVEEPNIRLFLPSEIESVSSVEISFPDVTREKCTGCRVCAEVCEYQAIAVLGNKVFIFPELCQACGACAWFCPQKAIREIPREIGKIQMGRKGRIRLIGGRLNEGEVLSPVIIKRVKERGLDGSIAVIDAPSGASWPVMAAVRDTDGVLLVTEPTPFGLHDLKPAVEMLRRLELPCAVAINRSTLGEKDLWRYCLSEQLPIVLEIPDDRRIAEACSQGKTLLEAFPEYREIFLQGWQNLQETFGVS